MSKVMLVNVTHVEESRVAVLDDGVLDTYEIETINQAQIKGNIYNAVVDNVHPSLEAAFLKITPDGKGFLPLDEVNFNLLPTREESRKAGRIGQHLRPGQRLMAQVVREPFAGKPPTVSTYFSLPGRFLVLMPGADTSGVSRKIEDPEQRDRLKQLVAELRPPEGFGLIVRTAGLEQTKLELQRDLRYLLRLWQSVQRSSQAGEFPGLVYREADLVIRTIRDHLSMDVEEVWIDSKETYEKALAFVQDVMPNRAKTLRLYTGDRPLFNKFNLEEQIESIYKRRVSLPSGGEIVIDGTEALTAVDVNSARSRRQGDAGEIVLQTNLEAAAEIARQLRLRDLGGLIVIDFIDMDSSRHNKKVEDAMRAAMRGDRARHDLTRLSKMGLMEIARQRLKSAKMSQTYTACPTCEGYGLIKNLEAAALTALRKLQTRSTRDDVGRIRVAVPPDVATWMLNHKRDDLVQIERRRNLTIDIEPRAQLLRHQAEFEILPREEGARDEARAPVLLPERPAAEPEPVSPPALAAPAAVPDAEPAREPLAVAAPAAESGPGEPRRRRRRRGRRGGGASDARRARESHHEPERGAEGHRGQEGDRGREPEPPASDEAPHDVAPGPPPAPSGSTGAHAAPDGREGGGRRRRRRRRGRSRAAEPGQAAGEVAPRAAPDDEPVPREVRSDELMPAAVGGRRRRGGGRRGNREAD